MEVPQSGLSYTGRLLLTSGEGGLRVGELCTAKRCLTMLCLRQTVQTLLCSSSSHVLPPPPPQYNEYGTTPEEAVCGRNHGQAVINSGLSITRLTVNRSFFQFLCTVERKTWGSSKRYPVSHLALQHIKLLFVSFFVFFKLPISQFSTETMSIYISGGGFPSF